MGAIFNNFILRLITIVTRQPISELALRLRSGKTSDPVTDSIGGDVDGAVEVGSPDFCSGGFIPLNHFRMWVVHPVQVAAGENNRLRLDGAYK